MNFKTQAQRDADVISKANNFVAFMFAGRTSRFREDCANQAEAKAKAQALADLWQKPALLYAVDAIGRQALVETVNPARH